MAYSEAPHQQAWLIVRHHSSRHRLYSGGSHGIYVNRIPYMGTDVHRDLIKDRVTSFEHIA